MSGTILTRLEDSAGITPLPITSAVAGESGVLVLSAKTASTRIDGTLSISNFACDISATSCGPQNASFTGSLTNLADTAVGMFANLTITDTMDYSGFNSTLPQTNANSAKTVGSIVGTITNNKVTPVATYQFTLNASTTNASPDSLNIGLIYQDPSATVSATSVLDINPLHTPTNTINIVSGAVLAVLQSNNSAGTTTGNVYVGSVAPANLIGTYGTVNGVDTISFTDNTFFSLQ